MLAALEKRSMMFSIIKCTTHVMYKQTLNNNGVVELMKILELREVEKENEKLAVL